MWRTARIVRAAFAGEFCGAAPRTWSAQFHGATLDQRNLTVYAELHGVRGQYRAIGAVVRAAEWRFPRHADDRSVNSDIVRFGLWRPFLPV
jgi:hypothetical protein